MVPKFTGSTNLGRVFNQAICCNLTRTSGGKTIIGVAFNTRLSAVSPTASTPALLLFPKLSPLLFRAFSSSVRTAYTSIPFLISSPRIKNTLSAPAEATAAKGTSRTSTVFVVGERERRRGTMALRPRATEQEAETARK